VISAIGLKVACTSMLDVLSRKGLLIDARYPVIQGAAGTSSLSWGGEGAPFAFSDAGSIPEYRRLVIAREYSCLFRDGGFIQISASFRNGKLTKQRFSYYPCPITGLYLAEDDEIPFPDFFDEALLTDYHSAVTTNPLAVWDGDTPCPTAIRLKSPIRFDYDPASSRPGHPTSHVTVVSNDVRIACRGALSLSHFVSLVLTQFYGKFESDFAAMTLGSRKTGAPTISATERDEIHFAW
jgi:hypothetical protein